MQNAGDCSNLQVHLVAASNHQATTQEVHYFPSNRWLPTALWDSGLNETKWNCSYWFCSQLPSYIHMHILWEGEEKDDTEKTSKRTPSACLWHQQVATKHQYSTPLEDFFRVATTKWMAVLMSAFLRACFDNVLSACLLVFAGVLFMDLSVQCTCMRESEDISLSAVWCCVYAWLRFIQ